MQKQPAYSVKKTPLTVKKCYSKKKGKTSAVLKTRPWVLGNKSVSAGESNFQNMSVWSSNWASNFLKSKF